MMFVSCGTYNANAGFAIACFSRLFALRLLGDEIVVAHF
jgi:hypothetical protein